MKNDEIEYKMASIKFDVFRNSTISLSDVVVLEAAVVVLVVVVDSLFFSLI
jgi:hypothetical protein